MSIYRVGIDGDGFPSCILAKSSFWLDLIWDYPKLIIVVVLKLILFDRLAFLLERGFFYAAHSAAAIFVSSK